MIRALISGDTPDGVAPNKLLILGFNHGNLADFAQTNTPVAFNLAKYGYPDLSLAICFAETDEQIVADIKDNLGVEVPVRDCPEDPQTNERISG